MNREKTSRMAQLALLLAVVLLMAFTPLGYLNVGPLSITFLVVPVVIGSIVLGAKAGCFLGAVFGLTSLAQCFGINAFGTALMAINPAATVLVCLLPRVLVGLLSWLVYRALAGKPVACYAAAVTGSLTNSVLFLGGVILFFGSSDYVRSFGGSVFEILMALGLVNALVEVLVCAVVGGLLGRACLAFRRKKEA